MQRVCVSLWISLKQIHGRFINRTGHELQRYEIQITVCWSDWRYAVRFTSEEKESISNAPLPPSLLIQCICSASKSYSPSSVAVSREEKYIARSQWEEPSILGRKRQKHANFHSPKKNWPSIIPGLLQRKERLVPQKAIYSLWLGVHQSALCSPASQSTYTAGPRDVHYIGKA